MGALQVHLDAEDLWESSMGISTIDDDDDDEDETSVSVFPPTLIHTDGGVNSLPFIQSVP